MVTTTTARPPWRHRLLRGRPVPQGVPDNLFIGNVVTNRINRDQLEWRGSTPKGIELPDFLTSDDPWFRPVDLELGPDGAIYVADFYNRIIGHYEVPLTHPGRDRERGRIWRIVYRGPDAAKPNRPGQVDLTRAAETDLIKNLAIPTWPSGSWPPIRWSTGRTRRIPER